VVHAIADAGTPVISAVGHEVDVALSDLAADYRAPTPSAAAEVVAASRGELLRRVTTLRGDLARTLEGRAQRHRALLDRFGPEQLTRSMRLLTHPVRQRLDEARAETLHAVTTHAGSLRHRLELAARSVAVASPRAVLERGFALVTAAADGRYVTDPHQVRRGEQVRVRFHRGALHAEVTGATTGTDTDPKIKEDSDGNL
jgi:exodeoxyribonuclease VII large subunit